MCATAPGVGFQELRTVITELEFKSLAAQGFNRIPLLSEAFADLETPLSLYLKLAGAGLRSYRAGVDLAGCFRRYRET